ncbi:AhpC/TSA family protein [Tepidimonas ignava]|uniref:AhpC/TSA family protein n=1 Tax=Tepidimonas ignava TaxID=114249 RepID=A0A4R3LEH1_9BURK|nr:thioredoxin family protein [Tepidimonas ignava]TCS97795.1 AhpC/TSA family protein [Tepidimonas ignava]TSE23657.1 Thiol-disulfide oxidoreductase ResA [Tepidimonas ignava]
MAAIPPVCDFGWKAPGFELPGVDGRRWRYEDIRGPKGTLVMFICNHCPYVQAILPRLVPVTRQLLDMGIGVAAISSNDPEAYPEDSFDNMQRVARERGFPFPYLYDETQEVARTWGAVCTPDFFGFNAADELQYRGRFDASRKETAPEGTPCDLLEAMQRIAATGQGPREQIASIGCSIKWRSA